MSGFGVIDDGKTNMNTSMHKILIIIQRSNGDVFLSLPLIHALHQTYPQATLDLLINDDTLSIAKTLPYISTIHLFSYSWKKQSCQNSFKLQLNLIKKIFRKYDLAISLTASDRSVQYALLAGKKTILAVEKNSSKSWWKKLFGTHTYPFNSHESIVLNNCQPLHCLGIPFNNPQVISPLPAQLTLKQKLATNDIHSPFLIVHLSAQYAYKIYPLSLRLELLSLLDTLNIPLIFTGGTTPLDNEISQTLPSLTNGINWIGKTSINELLELCSLSAGYIGMDTLVMHLCAGFNKPIFAIFGPTLTTMWKPWKNTPEQPITLFQASLPCVPCGKAGCDDKHGKSECLDAISPQVIFETVQKFFMKD